MINFKNIFFHVNSHKIFDSFNLEVTKGEKLAIKGRSGKGKTTLFNMLMGFVQPDAGEIVFDGMVLTSENIGIVRKRISWLPQNPSIIGRGNIREQILQPFNFSINKILKPDDTAIAKELEQLNLSPDILDSSFEEISGGEKQRLAIMICKLLKRDLMLLDEPTSALDKNNLDAVAKYLLLENEVTVISASHDEEWLKHCDRVVDI